MTRQQLGIVFAALFVVALLVSIPLGLAMSVSGLSNSGLTARRAEGTIWGGSLIDARFGALVLGDVKTALSPFPLLVGRGRVRVWGPVGRGTIVAGQGRSGVDNATARLSTAGLFAPIPLSAIDLEDVSIAFRGGRCDAASGRVRATFTSGVAGLSLAQGLSGAIRCEGRVLLVPLVSQSTMERLNLRVSSDGSYRAEFIVRSIDPALNAKLMDSGFLSTQGGYALRLTGTL